MFIDIANIYLQLFKMYTSEKSTHLKTHIVGEVTWHGGWFPPTRHFTEMLTQIFFTVHVILYPQNNFFQNCQFFSNCEPSDMYISLSFLYKSGTLEAYISLHSDICFLHIVCLGMLDSGWSDMAWQMNPLPQEEEFHWSAANYFLYM